MSLKTRLQIALAAKEEKPVRTQIAEVLANAGISGKYKDLRSDDDFDLYVFGVNKTELLALPTIEDLDNKMSSRFPNYVTILIGEQALNIAFSKKPM